jgi:hypothetical protein
MEAEMMLERLPETRRRVPYNSRPSRSYLLGEQQTNSTEE